MRDLLFRSRVFTYLAAATPGLRELVTIGKVWEVAQLDRKVREGRRYDLVIVDAPATGHGIAFLQTPRMYAGIARVGPIHTQALQLDAMVTDHARTGVAIVCLPEEMPVNETAALETSLSEEVGVAVDHVYMNGIYPERFSPAQAKTIQAAIPDLTGRAHDAAAAALSEHRRNRTHKAQLARLRRRVSAPVTTLPFVFEPSLGLDSIRSLGERL
jgi:anion-transporting  ArsA/GET3 family ATPase